MPQEEYDRRLAELEAEADRRGCCIIPANPIPPPDGTPENPDNPGKVRSRAPWKSAKSYRTAGWS